MKNIEIFQIELRRINKDKEHNIIINKIKKLEKERIKLLIELEKLQYI